MAEETGKTTGASEAAPQEDALKKQTKQERDPADKDAALQERITGDSKVSRQLFASICLLAYIVIEWIMGYTYQIFSTNNYVESDAFDNLTDESQEEEEDFLALYRVSLAASIFLLLALIDHLFYYFYITKNQIVNYDNNTSDDNGKVKRRSDPMSLLCPCIPTNDKMLKMFFWRVIAWYVNGILLLVIGFFMLLNIYFNEDWSSIQEDNFSEDTAEGTVNGFKTQVWSYNFIKPLLFIVLLLQFLKPDRLLGIFEWRIFLYSFSLTLTLLIYMIYFISKDHWEYNIDDDYKDEEEGSYSAASIFAAFGFLLSCGICIIAGMKLLKMDEFSVKGGSGNAASDASYVDVYKMWVILVVVLFFLMLAFTVSASCDSIVSFFTLDLSIAYCWVATIMIVTDVLF